MTQISLEDLALRLIAAESTLRFLLRGSHQADPLRLELYLDEVHKLRADQPDGTQGARLLDFQIGLIEEAISDGADG